MESSKAVSLIFVGSILLYLAIFGLTFFGGSFKLSFQVATYENFFSYAERDSNNHITVASSTQLTFASYFAETAYMYRDMGVDYFGDSFIHEVDFKFRSSPISGAPNVNFWAVTNGLNDLATLQNSKINYLCARIGKNTVGGIYVFIQENYNGVAYNSASDIGWVMDAWYYATITRSPTTFVMVVYSDSARTLLKQSFSVTLHANIRYRYIMPAVTFLQDGSTEYGTADIANLALSGGGEQPTTGTLVVSSQYQSNGWVAGSAGVSVDGGTTYPTPYTFTLTAGSHIVTVDAMCNGLPFYQWSDGATSITKTVSISVGSTVSLVAFYQSGNEPIPTDLLSMIRQFLSNQAVKMVLAISGIGCIGFGFIGLFLKPKPKARPSYLVPTY